MEQKISVIIPVYNVEKYIERCLDSVINNAYKNLEIICVNDGSTDGCLNILKRYANKDKRITVINKENGGLSSARNAGFERCTGDFIEFIDSDDWVHNEYFSIMMNVQQKNDCDIVICDYIKTNNKDALNYGIDKFGQKQLDKYGFISRHRTKPYVWGKIYKRNIIENIRFDEKEKVEDALYNVMCVQNNKTLHAVYIDAKLYAYFMRKGSLISFIDAQDIIKLAEKYFEYAKAESDQELKNILFLECLKRSLSSRNEYYIVKDKVNYKYCNSFAKASLRLFKGKKMKYWIMVTYPMVYRWFRIWNDPTMLAWEKNIKNKRLSKSH